MDKRERIRDLTPPLIWRLARHARRRLSGARADRAGVDELDAADLLSALAPATLATCLFYYDQLRDLHTVPGDVVEFGVFRGSMMVFLGHCIDLLDHPQSSRHLLGFDTFTGFPDSSHMAESRAATDRQKQNHFRHTSVAVVNGKLARCRVRSTLIVGDVFNTLPMHLREWPNRIAMAICDMDSARTTKFILEQIWERMSPGGRIYFDQYSRDGWSETEGVDAFLTERHLNLTVTRINGKPSGMIEVLGRP